MDREKPVLCVLGLWEGCRSQDWWQPKWRGPGKVGGLPTSGGSGCLVEFCVRLNL